MKNSLTQSTNVAMMACLGFLVITVAGCGTNPVETAQFRLETADADGGSSDTSIGSDSQIHEKQRSQKQAVEKLVIPEHRPAVMAVTLAGGSVSLDNQNRVMIVNLASRPITDEMLTHLEGLTSLVFLNLEDTAVTNEGMAHLKELSELKFLRLSRTAITDEGLKHVAGLDSLVELYLYNTAVTDAGLKHLTGLTNLRRVRIKTPNITQNGIDLLTTALPNCSVK